MFDLATALCDILYKRLRNTLTYLLTYNCTVISTHIWAVHTDVLKPANLALQVSLFCLFGVFSVVCFELSVPVQVNVWKDSSPKW